MPREPSLGVLSDEFFTDYGVASYEVYVDDWRARIMLPAKLGTHEIAFTFWFRPESDDKTWARDGAMGRVVGTLDGRTIWANSSGAYKVRKDLKIVLQEVTKLFRHVGARWNTFATDHKIIEECYARRTSVLKRRAEGAREAFEKVVEHCKAQIELADMVLGSPDLIDAFHRHSRQLTANPLDLY